jgi:hypothetical protein
MRFFFIRNPGEEPKEVDLGFTPRNWKERLFPLKRTVELNKMVPIKGIGTEVRPVFDKDGRIKLFERCFGEDDTSNCLVLVRSKQYQRRRFFNLKNGKILAKETWDGTDLEDQYDFFLCLANPKTSFVFGRKGEYFIDYWHSSRETWYNYEYRFNGETWSCVDVSPPRIKSTLESCFSEDDRYFEDYGI